MVMKKGYHIKKIKTIMFEYLIVEAYFSKVIDLLIYGIIIRGDSVLEYSILRG
ncbi:hypothetical protein [Clostridium diolis]|uniref:hypothetical protein n=1 Tax=Clostridium diolis TaxID=223919 RepID=UPI003AF8D4EA